MFYHQQQRAMIDRQRISTLNRTSLLIIHSILPVVRLHL